jgi:large subunit ribosomal protein L29
MKASELHGKSDGEIKELERELREKLFRLRMKLFTGQLEQTSEIKDTRRDIARVLTILGSRG